jgi:hypothetical protein
MANKRKDGNSFYEARRRKETALAELRELEVAKAKGEAVPIADFLKWIEPLIIETVRLIECSSMTEDEKFNLRTAIAKVYEPKIETAKKD